MTAAEAAQPNAGHPYKNQKIALTTKHEKLHLIAPAFSEQIGCELVEVNLDTDELGTFTGEIERSAPPRDTAIAKARLGMRAAGLQIGIASEGSIGADPLIPFLQSDIEHLVLVDDVRGIVIAESYRTFEITAATITAAPGDDLAQFFVDADFPHHALIVRPSGTPSSDAIKGIADHQQLLDAIASRAPLSPDGLVVIESDLRAMHSPSRQKNITEAAKLLAARVAQLCPACHLPGWGRVGYERGLPCHACGRQQPNALRQEILGCVACDHIQPGTLLATALDPANCGGCNP